ncbi:chromate transporter [Odoribacter sp. OttesenSCG-928-J03]|nr:chromate transporter [Odoribacter sp. OttesenSCG-928-J03]MDL2283179.1 chromate transporter [Odoribacter sp. OttesenSCG-928-G04]MDL2331126.1 chromate transporter [Odoribacter sp. OttesenSCG-928-A06]
MEELDLYIELFWVFFKIGLFGFGGGYAMLSLVQNEVVVNHQWISVSDFTDIVAISQTTPGPIAFNTATYIGYTATGTVWGSVIATVAVSIPSIVFMTIVCKLFFKFKHNPYVGAVMKLLKPTLIGLIAAAAIMLINSTNFPDYVSWIIFAGVFLASLKRVDPILLIVSSGVMGYLVY